MAKIILLHTRGGPLPTARSRPAAPFPGSPVPVSIARTCTRCGPRPGSGRPGPSAPRAGERSSAEVCSYGNRAFKELLSAAERAPLPAPPQPGPRRDLNPISISRRCGQPAAPRSRAAPRSAPRIPHGMEPRDATALRVPSPALLSQGSKGKKRGVGPHCILFVTLFL